MPSSIKNHHFLTKSGPTSHPVGSQGVEPHILKSPEPISRTNSDSLMAVSELKILSRREGQGNKSTYRPCGIICCCKVGVILGGKLGIYGLMLKPFPWIHASSSMVERQESWSISAMRPKAAKLVKLCMMMKWLSIVGSGHIGVFIGTELLKRLKSVDAAGKGWYPTLDSVSSLGLLSTWLEHWFKLFFCLLRNFAPSRGVSMCIVAVATARNHTFCSLREPILNALPLNRICNARPVFLRWLQVAFPSGVHSYLEESCATISTDMNSVLLLLLNFNSWWRAIWHPSGASPMKSSSAPFLTVLTSLTWGNCHPAYAFGHATGISETLLTVTLWACM